MPKPLPDRAPAPLRLQGAFHAHGSDSVGWHSHETAELVYVVEGDIRIDVGEEKLPGSPGTLYILPPSQPHAQISHGSWHTLCVLFGDDLTTVETSARTIATSHDTYLVDWLNNLCSFSRDTGQRSQYVEDCLLLTVLARVHDIERMSADAAGLSPRYLEAVAFLNRNATRAVTSGELAAATHTSYSHLGQLFRQRHGCGPLQYHQKLRMEHACRVLLNPYTTISETARICGYHDANYFARAFARTFGISPGTWRKETAARLDSFD